MVAMSSIKELADQIAERFDPERIVLFGSYAYGNPGPDSDVDLLVIMHFEGKSFWKSLEIANLVNPSFSVDLLTRRPEDAEQRYALGDPVIREAFDHGRVLYERCCSRMD